MSNLPASATINRRKKAAYSTENTFPKDLGDSRTVLMFRNYAYNNNRNLVRSTTLASSGSIYLPLPKQLSETQGIRAQPTELGSMGALAADFATGGFSTDKLREIAKNLNVDVTDKDGATIASDVGNAIKYFARSTIDQLFPGAGSALGVSSGKAINPHSVIQFEGVDMKTHTFSWSLMPANEAESNAIKHIIRELKRRALPSYEGVGGTTLTTSPNSAGSLSRALLTYPSEVMVYFLGIDQSYWYYLKPCMIQNISVDYSANGLSVIEGGKPATIDLTIQMVELQIHTSADYQDGNDMFFDPTGQTLVAKTSGAQ